MRRTSAVAAATFALLALACGPAILVPRLHPVAETPRLAPSARGLKVHMVSGELYVFDTWTLDPEGKVLDGHGDRFSAGREQRGSGEYSLPVDAIALLETNDREVAGSLGLAGLGALTVFWGGASVYCAANPKSCFGSCPTFYLEDDPGRPRAEGFSSSIARVLEARDVDALPDARPRGDRLVVWMRNEALETHAVRRVRLLAAPKPAGTRVFAGADGRFHPASRLHPPLACGGPEGDCLAAVTRDDGLERRSAADAEDLATREDLELRFDRPTGPSGLVIAARQSLLTTFLFYQTLAYLGANAGDWLASVERGTREDARSLMGMERLLGGIEIAVAEEGGWHTLGTFAEAGPIAGDVAVFPLEPSRGRAPLRVRLRSAKGHWRIGWAALAELRPPVEAQVVPLDSVQRDGRVDAAGLARLREGRRHLVTQPGDAYRLSFRVPVAPAELFLESEGYYYEWMRREWLAEEDPAMAALVVARPDEALRRLAGPFKAAEAGAEQAFWASRFRR
ncbi:MAG TPA: hypothetical protein VFM88_20375 [Vicinamibacteria bacterium]|nr:hypothetical protein [Vicinamibacteria bacterium]